MHESGEARAESQVSELSYQPQHRYRFPLPGKYRGPGTCRWCGSEVKPPRRSWCSDFCVVHYLSQRGTVRQRALARNRRRNRGELRCEVCDRTIIEFRKGRRTRGESRVDHKVPLALGGDPTDPANLQVLCLDCDKRKTSSDLSAIARARREATAEYAPMDPW